MENIIELNNIDLKVNDGQKNEVHILRDINFSIKQGESLAIIGESGCGKSTLGKVILNTLKNYTGSYKYHGVEVSKMNSSQYKKFRLAVQVVQQDSFAALNLYKTIGESLSFAIKHHGFVKDNNEAKIRVEELLTDVGLVPTEEFIDKYPHQLSGGQRQRVLIARAISVNPELIVADEPVSMVDVSLRISLLSLMREMTSKYNVSFLYITHDIATARYISDKGNIALMYLGEIVEMKKLNFKADDVKHPYFKALIASLPNINVKTTFDTLPLKSMVIADIKNLPKGCKFEPRCIYSCEKCFEPQVLNEVDGTFIRCWKSEKI